MDYLQTLDQKTLIGISNDFDYMRLISSENLVGLKLMPFEKTDNMKLTMHNFLEGSDVPVTALVHALDTEARIGDRIDAEEFEMELFLIKEKINQGEELKKKIKDLGMSRDDKARLVSIYDDIANQITKVVIGFERRACELLSTGKNVIDENGAKKTIDHKLSAKNKIDFTGWSDPTHDILGDLVALQKSAKNKIVRQIVSDKIVGYILANEKLNAIATADTTQNVLSQDYAFAVIKKVAGTTMSVDDRTYKFSHKDTKEYRFFDEDTIISLTTMGEIGKTFMTTTPTEDFNSTDLTYGYVAVDQYKENDPKALWTLAEGLGLSVIKDINKTLFLSKIAQ